MFMSSPFRASHRRSRSYSSVSSTSSPPVTRADSFRAQQIRSPAFARTSSGYGFSEDDFAVSAGSTFNTQPPDGRWDVDSWRCTKRARREPSAQFEDADAGMDTDDEPVPSSPVEAHILPDTTMQWATSTSAPTTPHLPSTSDAFHFFPSRSSTGSKRTPPAFPAHTATAAGISDDAQMGGQGLAQAHSEAFSDLRRTVFEAGESFVQRMREFEEDHHARERVKLRVSTKDTGPYSRPDAARRIRNRGRKRGSPLSKRDHHARTESERAKDSDNADDDSDDVEIRSIYASGSDDDPVWSPSKKRAFSLCEMGGKEQTARPHPYSLPFAIPLRKGERSSSPSACTNSSDDDEDECAGRPRPTKMRRRTRYTDAFSGNAITPPLSFSLPTTSNNSSMVSLPPVEPSLTANSVSPQSPEPPLQSARSSKTTEKAVAALSLAIANGAGSVSDYDALRSAQDIPNVDDSEVGSLWD